MIVSEAKPSTEPIRVMIVDDSVFMRKALERLVQSAPDIQVCISCSSGEDALAVLDVQKPDVITMDVSMPGMGGINAVRAIMAKRRTPIIMLSALTSKGADSTIQALENGAADFIAKPTDGMFEIGGIADQLIQKIRVLGRQRNAALQPGAIASAVARPVTGTSPAVPPSRVPPSATHHHNVECIVIGVSTGGPAALAVILAKVRADVRVPILIVQHMPTGFTKALAERLNAQCPLNVIEATDHMTPRGGQVILGMAGKQMRVHRAADHVEVLVSDSAGESLYQPSADVLFTSVAEVYGPNAVGFIMTGMGNDGTAGLKRMKHVGAFIYGQDEATSVVYGMPRAAAQAGLVDVVLALDEIPAAIMAAGQSKVYGRTARENKTSL